MYYSTTYPSPVGDITLACDGERLAGAWIAGQKYHGGLLPEEMSESSDCPVLDAAKHWLDRYFAGGRPDCASLPLAPAGSKFRQAVWAILREIPYGETITYGGIAKKLAAKLAGESMSAQAVGGAVGHNPLSIIIPCHRVVGSDGSLTGYAGGIDIKVKLLTLEGADMSALYVPKKGTVL